MVEIIDISENSLQSKFGISKGRLMILVAFLDALDETYTRYNALLQIYSNEDLTDREKVFCNYLLGYCHGIDRAQLMEELKNEPEIR